MDDKTVIVRPKASKPGNSKPVEKAKAVAKAKPAVPAPKPGKPSNYTIITLGLFAILFAGFASALASIYFFSAATPTDPQVTAQDLNQELVPVADASSEAEDEALVKAAIAPRIINLSGDPVIMRQLAMAPRQQVKLDRDVQKKAAADIGFAGDVFRVKDVLDIPNDGLQAGLAGSQEDIAALNTFEPPPSDKNSGYTAIETISAAATQSFHEFTQQVKARTGIADALRGLGTSSQSAAQAQEAFAAFYGLPQLQKGDKLAVRAIVDLDNNGALLPVQVSVYAASAAVRSIALDDLDHYARAADPWAGQDIFSAELLPQHVRPEDRPRLLDAIYAAALRNNLPTAVTGEAIMLMSRAEDLEQKTQDGDTITIVYSPQARDPKTGLGRIVYIKVGRTTGTIECYAFQPQAGAKFDCASASGESGVPDNGMVLPVNGVIAAKFGAQADASGDAKANMNFGVDWTAPEGSPVVAAYDGDVQSAGPEATFGTVVRLSHADNKTTMYAYLQRLQAGLGPGQKIKAGQVLGYVGMPPSSRAARLHFELRQNDVPVDPLPEAQPSAGGGGIVDQFVHRIITIESANRCTAHNPLSTAVGLGQFIESTWMTTISIHRPDLLAGHTRQQVLDLRLDCNLSRTMTTFFTRDNAAVLRRSGASVTPGNLYLAHFLGVGGAVKALTGSPNRTIGDVFGAAHVRANPFEMGKTLGYLAAWAAKKMGAPSAVAPAVADNKGTTATAPGLASANDKNAAAAAAQAPVFAQYDANPAFTKLKTAVLAFLQ